MSPVQAKLLANRAAAVTLDARRKPECAEAARNFLALVVRYAERHGQGWLAEEIRLFEREILGEKAHVPT